jgi:hypothetical protein
MSNLAAKVALKHLDRVQLRTVIGRQYRVGVTGPPPHARLLLPHRHCVSVGVIPGDVDGSPRVLLQQRFEEFGDLRPAPAAD